MDCNLLLVDDTPDVSATFKRALAADGYTIFTASTSEEGMSLLRKHPMDVVVYNHELSDHEDSAAFLKDLSHCYPETVRVLITAHDEIDDVVATVNDGTAYRLIAKPWRNDALREVIRDAAGRAQAEHREVDPQTGWLTRRAFCEKFDELSINEKAPGQLWIVEIINSSLVMGFLRDDEFKHLSAEIEQRCRDAADVVLGVANLDRALFAVAVGDDEDPSRVLIPAFNEPINTGIDRALLKVRVGVSKGDVDAEAEEHIRRAMIALTSMDDMASPQQVQTYSAGLTARLHQRFTLEQDLHQGLERSEFFYLLQPQVDVETLDVRGAELLLRWNHRLHGLISPLDFIDMAERTGLIQELGMWVIQQGLAETVRIAEFADNIRIAVNVSPRQFRHSDWVEAIAEFVTQSGMSAGLFEIEITENAVMDSLDYAHTVLSKLRGLGVRVALDDFGTGHSALSQLSRLPLDVLKFDHTFIREVVNDDSSLTLLRHVTHLANDLGLETVAEGIETAEQFDICRDLGVDLVQGFYFHKPMEPAALTRVLRGDATGTLH